MGKHKQVVQFDLKDTRCRLFRMRGWDAAPAFRAAADWLEDLQGAGSVTVICASADYGEYGEDANLVVTVEAEPK